MKKLKMYRNRNHAVVIRRLQLAGSVKGLSLVETLLVVALIAVVAALLFPVFSRGRAKAEELRCLQQLRTSGQMVRIMIAEKGVAWATFAEGAPETNQWPRRLAAAGLISERKLLRCPKGATTYSPTHTAWAWQSYGLNLSNLEVGVLEKSDGIPSETSYTLYPARVQDPARHLLLADSATNTSGQPLQTFRVYHKEQYRSGVYAWHDGRANLFFFDGHAESVKAADLAAKGAPYYDRSGNFQVPLTPLP